MGALGLGSALYGAVRGVQDADANYQQEQAFDLNQRVRQQALDEQTANAPLRRRAAEADVTRAESALSDYNAERPLRLRDLTARVNTSELTEKELREGAAREAENRVKRDRFLRAIGARDPQMLAEAFANNVPGEPLKNPQGTVDANGNIVLSADGVPTQTIGPAMVEGKPQGDPWEHATWKAYQAMNQMGVAKSEYDQRQAIAKEKEKQKTIGEERANVALINERSRATVAEATQRRQANDQVSSQVDKLLRTKSELGALISGYANTEDAELSGPIKQRARELVSGTDSEGNPIAGGKKTVEAAVNQAANEYRQTYDALSQRANAIAADLAKSGINPTDTGAVERAAEGGNGAASDLMKLLNFSQQKMGYGVRRHLQRNITVKKEKK